ncbi:NAC domain-containing protein 14-like [Juglans microcarpa x Juglans regia]|uniref:NAC domain-containing protein 14-like n=1 Tax=Juglans microcarpa x Juglans regia TaxID=2249226 RepID=UPI001B7F1304|nr:NAC domain-containing protein 14-like [Juglans microcarpa x Juglans regia]
MDALSLKVQPWMRFDPPEDKVIDFFLRAKITGNDELVDFIPEAQSCKWEPWDLKACLDSCGINTACPERWFFSPLDLKHRSGNRSNRATDAGFWKVTGNDKIIMSETGIIGKKKFLVFYRGRGKGEKTDWVIHEYHTTLKDLDGTHPGQNAFVLCRLSYKHEKSIKDQNINDAGHAVSSPAISKLFHEESESELLLASVFPASGGEATTTPENCDETISGTTTAAECDDKHISAHAAENQLGELTITNDDLKIEEMIIELQQIEACDVLTPSTSLHNNPTVSSAATAKSSLEEIESTRGLDSVSYNACAARNEVPEAPVSEFEEGLSLSDLPSEPPDCNLSSLFHPLDTQLGMSDPVTYDSNNSPSGTYFQYGAYKPAAHDHELSDPMAYFDNEYIQNMSVSQKNLTVVSNKDNGSCTGSGAKMANKPLEWCDQNCYNAYTAKKEVLEATASEVDLQLKEGLYMFDLLPKPPDCNLDMPFGMPCPVTDDSNNSHCRMDFHQKNLTLVSIKDSHANAPLESTFQDSGRVSKRKASSGLVNLESHMNLLNIRFLWMLPNQMIIRNLNRKELQGSSSTHYICTNSRWCGLCIRSGIFLVYLFSRTGQSFMEYFHDYIYGW